MNHPRLLPDAELAPVAARIAALLDESIDRESAAQIDHAWMLSPHGGVAAIGHDVDGELVWTPVIGRAM